MRRRGLLPTATARDGDRELLQHFCHRSMAGWRFAARKLLAATGPNEERERREVARLFIEAHPHRTIQGALYQIDQNLSTKP